MNEMISTSQVNGGTQLSDTDLLKGGLKKVDAYIRIDQSTIPRAEHDDNSQDSTPAPNSDRQKKHKDKRREEGFRQLNVELPDDERTREAIRDISKCLVKGSVDIRQIKDILMPDPVITKTLNQCRGVLERGGARGWLIKILAG